VSEINTEVLINIKIKPMKNIIYTLLICLAISCYPIERINFDSGFFPVKPVNFEQVNSYSDDYNSAYMSTEIDNMFRLTFSTNRFGSSFDFINFDVTVEQDLINGQLKFETKLAPCDLIDSVNSKNDELGPYFSNVRDSRSEGQFYYATNKNEDLDIYTASYSCNSQNKYYDYKLMLDEEPYPVEYLNSAYDDAYPSIHVVGNNEKRIIYFTSNRDGKFNIYQSTNKEEPSKTEILSSPADDKCPYTRNNLMVFSSNREGGFGGFDLWYSIFDGTQWSEPKNFGADINTEHDEYRPIVIDYQAYSYGHSDFLNNLMIFSSNRPGGKGGFDLYYVGISKDLK